MVEIKHRYKGTICRHCHKYKVNRPRGLCWVCYYTPSIREQHGSISHRCHRCGIGIEKPNAKGKKPRRSTPYAPGTVEKVEVMAARAAAGESLWHPGDANHSGEGTRTQ